MIQLVKAIVAGRSSKWPKVRAAHLKLNPACAACGTRSKLEVHHLVPFHLDPTRELDPTNLLTLCESSSHNCHLIWGHLLDWKGCNPAAAADSASYLAKLSASRGHDQP